MDTNKILIDWFAYSAQTPSKSEFEEVKKAEENLLLFELKECMGLDNEFVVFQDLPGMYFYKSRHAFNGISFLFDGMREDMGVCCQMSGKGCRTFETFGNGDYESLFNRCVHYSGMNISRIDIAYDDFEGILDMDKICRYTNDKSYVSPLSWYNVENGTPGSSVYFGAPSSDLRIRFYDKAKEQKIKEPMHWVRCEIQLRRELAFNFVNELVKDGTDNIGRMFVGVLNNYLRFLELGEDTNKQRREAALWWLDFVGDLEKIHLYEKPGTEYGEELLYNYVIRQAGNSIHTYIECFGIDRFFEDLKKRGTVLNPNQRKLIEKYKGVKKNDTVTND